VGAPPIASTNAASARAWDGSYEGRTKRTGHQRQTSIGGNGNAERTP
jgi:hypothetical protein